MEKGRRNSINYWDFMDIPLVVYLVYLLLNFFFPLTKIMSNGPAIAISLAVMIFVFGFVSYNVSKEKKDIHVRAGAYAGALVGLASAILSIASFYIFPDRFAATLQQAVQAGASMSTVKLFSQISLFAGLVMSPLIYAAIGAFIAWVGKFVFKNSGKKPEEKPKKMRSVKKK